MSDKSTPLSIEQAGNYLDSDFKKDALKQIGDIKKRPMHLSEMATGPERFLRLAIGFLKNEGTEVIYKKILWCRIHGATIQQISKVINEKENVVKLLERDAIKCVKDRIANRKVMPVVQV